MVLDDDVSARINKITLIFSIFIVAFFCVEVVFILMMRNWVKMIQNFSPKESVNPKVEYDDDRLKSYFTQKSSMMNSASDLNNSQLHATSQVTDYDHYDQNNQNSAAQNQDYQHNNNSYDKNLTWNEQN